MYDAIVIGAGPAGLNAALILGRCGRRIVVLDSGKPRNAASQGLHGFLSRDGTPPSELRRLGRADLEKYPTVEVHDATVTDAVRRDGHFEVETASGGAFAARLLLLATGRVDRLPEIDGFADLYGRGVYHCPYCDAWEHNGQAIAIHGDGTSAKHLAEVLCTWSRDLLICAEPAPDADEHPRVPAGVRVRFARAPIQSLRKGAGDAGVEVRFRDGTSENCGALFFCSECSQRSSLPERLGCEFDKSGSVVCRGHAATNVPGLYVAGNVRGGIHLAIVAAAEGAAAGIVMNDRLLELEA